jgi:hypothetical protein
MILSIQISFHFAVLTDGGPLFPIPTRVFTCPLQQHLTSFTVLKYPKRPKHIPMPESNESLISTGLMGREDVAMVPDL